MNARMLTGASSDCPSLVSAYSTCGGFVGRTVRSTIPSRSRPRSVDVSTRCEMPTVARLSALKRCAPCPRSATTSALYEMRVVLARMVARGEIESLAGSVARPTQRGVTISPSNGIPVRIRLARDANPERAVA